MVQQFYSGHTQAPQASQDIQRENVGVLFGRSALWCTYRSNNTPKGDAHAIQTAGMAVRHALQAVSGPAGPLDRARTLCTDSTHSRLPIGDPSWQQPPAQRVHHSVRRSRKACHDRPAPVMIFCLPGSQYIDLIATDATVSNESTTRGGEDVDGEFSTHWGALPQSPWCVSLCM